ncbi:MAG: hypothetical protein QXW56_03290 [Nitrososphaerota archaeon]
MPRRLMIELESAEELLRLAALVNTPFVMLDTRSSVLFLPDRGWEPAVFARLDSGSPWSGARCAVVNLLRGTIRPSEEPSTEAGEFTVSIVRARGIIRPRARTRAPAQATAREGGEGE